MFPENADCCETALNEFDLNKENRKKSYSFVDKKITLCTRHHNSLKLSILLPVRANLLSNLQCETIERRVYLIFDD